MKENKDKSLILNKIKFHYALKTNADLAKFLDKPESTIGTWYARNSIDYDLIFAKCVDMDKNYLIDDVEPALELNEPTTKYLLRTDRSLEKQAIPLYDIQAAAGLTKIFTGNENIIDYLSIPNLPKCDGALYITGDSMYPLLKAGDIAAYKILKDIPGGILWGEMYVLSFLLDGDDFITTKFVQKSDVGDDHVKLVSQNTYHSPKDIKIDDINAMAMIKASIRFNSMN